MMSTFDTEVGARTIAQEARGEPTSGQEGVAWVIRNSVTDGRWGKSVSSVCLWHARFSGWWSPRKAAGAFYKDPNFAYACGLQDDDPVLVKMRAALLAVFAKNQSDDTTKGAVNYYSVDIAAPDWAAEMLFTGQIGKHRFFKEKGLVA